MYLTLLGIFSSAPSYSSGDATIEIIIMLLIAFILGYLLRRFLSDSGDSENWKVKYDELSHKHSLLEEQANIYKTENRKILDEIERCKAEIEKCKDEAKLGFATVQESPKEPAVKDSLRKVEGIGPKIEQMLYDAGVYTWDALSKTEVSFIQDVLDKGGPAYKVHNPASWPFQAKLATEGKWEELKKWQDEHKHGLF